MKKLSYNHAYTVLSAVLFAVVQVLSIFDIYIGTHAVSAIISVVLGLLTAWGIIIKPAGSETAATDESTNEDEQNTNEN